jgi:hypothetical protein
VAYRFHPKRLFHFSLGSLLFVMLCVCAYFGGYRSGQVAADRDRYRELPSVRVYDLSDMLADLPTTAHRQRLYRQVITHLKASVPADAWGSSGTTRCGIHPFPAMHSLAVLQRGPLHDQIEAALHEFRQKHQENAVGG